jgi:pimeloyl-ACP methyl ester carboxylesterase
VVATLVLVHGGAVTHRMWDPLRTLVTAPTLAMDLPGRRYRPADLAEITRQDWIDAVCTDIVDADLLDVVLVAHSAAGPIIPRVAAKLPERTRHLVFIAGTVPAEGRAPIDYLRPDVRAAAWNGLRNRPGAGKTLSGLEPGEPPIDTDLQVVEIARFGHEAAQPVFEPCSWAGVPDVPRTYVQTMRDRVIAPDLQQEMIGNLGAADVVQVDAGHNVANSAPDLIAGLLDEIAYRY